jgi:hypothetical protein
MSKDPDTNVNDELEELQNPDNWDYERAERRPAAKGGRSIVSVAFPREDFEVVADAAEREGEKLSEFVRKAALTRARHHESAPATATVSGGGFGIALYADRPMTASRASGHVVSSYGFITGDAASSWTRSART